MLNQTDDDPDFAEHVRAVEAGKDSLIADAERLSVSAFARLEAAGIPRAMVDALARSLGSPPRQIPFAELLAALAERLTAQAEAARALASEWRAWDGRLAGFEEECQLRALSLGREAGRPC